MSEISAYAQVTRQMVTDISIDINKLEKRFDDFDAMNKQMFNHLSSRLPWWATASITGLASLTAALIVRGIYI